MKKENKFLLINAVIIVTVAIIFVLVNAFIVPKEPQDLLFGQKVETANRTYIEQPPTSGSYAIINYRENALDSSGNKVGTIYFLQIKNNYPNAGTGLIEIYLGIDQHDKVHVQLLNLNQTSAYHSGIQNYIYTYFSNVHYSDVANIPVVDVEDDISSGATASDSTGTIKELISRTVNQHFNVLPEDIYEIWYGEGYTKTSDEAFIATEYVIDKELVTDANGAFAGTIYKLVGTSIYHGTSSGSITLYLGFDANGQLIAHNLPSAEYQHTTGFRGVINNYLAVFVGKTLPEFAPIIAELSALIGSDDDLHAGATNTRSLVDLMLEDLIGAEEE